MNQGGNNTTVAKVLANYKTWLIAGICAITFFCYHHTLHNQFTNWDDDVYVSSDEYIRSFSADNLKAIFTKDIDKSNYLPLCILSLAVNYHFSELHPETYYLTNILIHVANVFLVFLLAGALCSRLKVSKTRTLWMSGICALWFGIHPMHVESVAWIAERKDVLYTFFTLLGFSAYLKYTVRFKIKWLVWTFVLFILSCLSKPMAVVFPLSLLAIDVLLKRGLGRKMVLEKLPFFAASLFLGLYAIYSQKAGGAITSFGALTVPERIMYASYGFVMYVAKFFYPFRLSTFYPYPYRYIDGSLPFIYYASPVLTILFITVPAFISYKLNKEYFRVIAFGILFFIANLIFVLQIISCGAAIMADRYSYVAYFGLLFMVAYLITALMEIDASLKTVLAVVLAVISLWFSVLCINRTEVWHDSETLLKDAINKYPMQALLSYKWLGNYYLDEKNEPERADSCYSVLTMLHSADAQVYDKIGFIDLLKHNYPLALQSLNKSAEMGGASFRTFLDRASCLYLMGDSGKAVQDFVLANRINPDAPQKASEIAFTEVQNKHYEDAIARYNILLTFFPNNAYYYFYRGVGEFGLNNMNGAAQDFKHALVFNNREVSVVSAYNLSVACDSLGDDSSAIRYANAARTLGYDVDPGYFNKLKRKLEGQDGRNKIYPQRLHTRPHVN